MPPVMATPGPRHLFARGRANPLGLYLGTCIVAPEPESEFFKIPVMNDLGGRSVPFQLIQDGEKDVVVAVMNRFNLPLLRAMRAVAGGGSALGSESGYARGTLVLGVNDFELIIVNGYAGTAASATIDLEAGRRYYSANLMKYKESTAGTRVLDVALAFECHNLFDKGTRGFGLFTETNLGPLEPIT